jgi:hypothetical protein
MLASQSVSKVVVLAPNTAIQGQWVRSATQSDVDSDVERDLEATLTALTYQAVATFDADAEDEAEDRDDAPLMDRLHANGRALVSAMREAGPLLLVLDECHHLLEVWGRLLAEILAELPQARVLGLTATPPDALTSDEAELVAGLFGAVVFETSIPAVVKEGDLAPFAELVWLTEPTATEQDWLRQSAERFTELTTDLIAPDFGSIGLLTWLELRLGTAVGARSVSWSELSRAEPELCRAALRMHHAGLLGLPVGASVREEHRVPPNAEDWVALIDDWISGHLRPSTDPADHAVLERIRTALPSVGYTLTRRGVRAGRTPVDRVLARSEAKTYAAAAIARTERLALGSDLRLLVLCDHEFASATLPADLDGVISAQAGSARTALATLQADPETRDVLLVTGASVAASPEILTSLIEHVRMSAPDLAAELAVTTDEGVTLLTGPPRWSSRTWTPHVTSFFEDGGVGILVGTRGLLGEGWDARRVTGVIDLTSVTTTTAVVQTRGRALRVDPSRPDKVALNWTVVCVAPAHPRGDNDWRRLVRKHTGFFGVDADGTVVDGVAHLDPAFSPYLPPPAQEYGAVNARMMLRAEHRAEIAARWRVGEPYVDQVSHTVRVRAGSAGRLGDTAAPAEVVVRADRLDVRAVPPRPAAHAPALLGLAGVAGGATGWALTSAAAGAAVVLAGGVGAWAARRWSDVALGRQLVAAASRPPSLTQLASAVAEALHATGLVEVGADGVRVEFESTGEYRARLAGVDERDSALFATALEEVLAPLFSPRYVVPRRIVVERDRSRRELIRIGRDRQLAADGVVWHAMPSALSRRPHADAFATAWDHWIGGGAAVYTGSPEGAGVLAAQRGSDPFDVTTVVRREWS